MVETRIGRPATILAISFVVLILSLGCGGAILFTTLTPYLHARSWDRTKANVMILSLYENRRGRRARTIRCKGVYQYEFDGITYIGNNVSFVTLDPFGNFQKFLCDYLSIAKNSNTSECYVDPNNPRNAVLSLQFPMELLTLGFATLTFLGGFFSHYFTKAVARLKTGFSLGNSQVASGPLWSQERNWPLPLVVSGVYMLILAAFTISISIDTISKGMTLSIINLLIGIFQLIMAILCGIRTRKTKFGGLLILPNDVQEAGGSSDLCGDATLFVPRNWNGKPRLTMTWIVESDILNYRLVLNGSESPIIPLSLKDDPTSKFREFDFQPCTLDNCDLAGTEMVGLRIQGEVGGSPYIATFVTGKAFEYQSLATRRELGVSFRLLSEISKRSNATSTLG